MSVTVTILQTRIKFFSFFQALIECTHNSLLEELVTLVRRHEEVENELVIFIFYIE